MASSRDDFIIAIRSAFLKKSTQQKFSLLTLVFLSVFIILLSSLDFRAVRYLKIAINEVVYRSSFLVSIPENFLKDSFIGIKDSPSVMWMITLFGLVKDVIFSRSTAEAGVLRIETA